MNKTASIIFTLALVVGLGIIFLGGAKSQNSSTAIQNVEVRDGVQYVTINAKGGYLPGVSNAKAGITTKLVVKTKGTFDCSSSLVIKSIGYQKILPQTGNTEIDIGTPVAGVPLLGLCSMGMYNFSINFI
jgi:plastocyanin domain-containing protein